MRNWHGILVAVGVLLPPAALRAQGDAPLEVGAEAPAFTLPGATAEGPLAEPVRLDDFEGRTVVLAFFFKARTKG